MESFAVSAGKAQLGAPPEQNDAVASKPRLHLHHAVDVHDVASVDAEELLGIELSLDAGRRRTNEVAVRPDVKSDIVTVGLPPVDVGCSNNAQRTVHLHGDAIETVRVSLLAILGEIVAEKRAEPVVLV